MTASQENFRPRVGFIVGPTGSGKSALAIEVATRLGAEIVNADSRLFYRGLDIGTAKPSAVERARVAHHLIDICAPDDAIDAARFSTLARAAIDEIVRRGKRPLVVGGSGLYLRALQHGLCDSPAASPELRASLRQAATEHGATELHRELSLVDPAAAARIGCHDLPRIVRALEVFRLTGERLSDRQRRHGFSARRYDSLTIGLTLDRAALYRRIDERFAAMLAAGLVDEVRTLIGAGYRPDRPPLSTIGYRELAAHLRGELTMAAAADAARRESRRLAKRQLTWFRRDPEILWLDAARAGERALTERALTMFTEFFDRRAESRGAPQHHAAG
ncbi:MAG TPA: tRNA (adenosine(37)-N6)-dimethylallyltransferase MiaA [Candidatus Binataceae bacterium]|nr:tRNA (adenosine(37)-N6)-dimethylallyltransferase MiaA [Candidatus Binataceae bacterium]